ncbi:MAG TPA: hypothetical protein DHV25_03510 [Candidatus Kerfeldbacteria bacterium]|nr:hypothetical protein [Candidatus Kerfeldbacteria bacterium]
MNREHGAGPPEGLGDFEKPKIPKYWPEGLKEQAIKYADIDEEGLLKELAQVLPPVEIERIREVSRELAAMEKDIVKLDQVDRLRLLWQTSGVMDPGFLRDDFTVDPRVGRDSMPAFSHNRYQHSKLIGFYVKAVLSRLGENTVAIKNGVATAWFHDSGHSALAHTGDDFMVKNGVSDHEQRAIGRLKEPETQEFLKKHQLDESQIVDTIQEQGRFGQLQKVMDTLSYTTIDTAMYGNPKYPDSGAGMIADIEGLDPETGGLIVKSTEKWQDLLETRAEMMQRYYRSEEDMLADNAKLQVVRLAPKLDRMAGIEDDRTLRPELVGIYNDFGLWMGIKGFQIVWKDTPFKPKIDRLVQLATGDRSGWDIKKFATREEALTEQESIPPELRDFSFIMEPYTDYTDKTLDVYTRGEKGLERHELRAQKTKLTEEDTMYVVAVPK